MENTEKKEPIIDFKHTLKLHVDTYDTISKLVSLVKEIPKFEKLKNDVQLTKFLCDHIEELIPNNNKKIDKLTLLIQVFKEAFVNWGFNDADIDIVKKHVDF